jgi:hypothetical protein
VTAGAIGARGLLSFHPQGPTSQNHHHSSEVMSLPPTMLGDGGAGQVGDDGVAKRGGRACDM